MDLSVGMISVRAPAAPSSVDAISDRDWLTRRGELRIDGVEGDLEGRHPPFEVPQLASTRQSTWAKCRMWFNAWFRFARLVRDV